MVSGLGSRVRCRSTLLYPIGRPVTPDVRSVTTLSASSLAAAAVVSAELRKQFRRGWRPSMGAAPRTLQCPNGSGSRPGSQVRPGTPHPCALTAFLALPWRSCRSTGPGTGSRPDGRSRAAGSGRRIPLPSTSTGSPAASTPVTLAQSARPVGKFSPGTDRQPSESSSGSGMFVGITEVSIVRVDDVPAPPGAVVGAVVDEDPTVVADLVGGQARAVGGLVGLEHILDEAVEFRGGELGDRAGRPVQNRLSADDDGSDGHRNRVRNRSHPLVHRRVGLPMGRMARITVLRTMNSDVSFAARSG